MPPIRTRTAPIPTPTAQIPDPSAPEALRRLVGDADSFLDHILTVDLLHHRGAGGFDDLLSLADVDRIITSSGLRRPSIRVIRDGVPVSPDSWCRPVRTGSVTVRDQVDPGRLLDRFAAGDTLVLQSLQRWWPPLIEFCRDLELTLGHPVQANAYLTPAGAAGLRPHHDTHDVFVIQVAGTKHWELREPVIEAPLARHGSQHEVAAAQPIRQRLDLTPGHVLYLPRGFVHSASAQQGLSLHVTIGILATTAHRVLDVLLDQAAEDPRFRAALPVGYGTDPALTEQATKAVIADLLDWLTSVDPAAVAATLVEQFVTSRRPPLTGQLLALETLPRLDDSSSVSRRPGGVHRGTSADGCRRSTLGDRHLELPAVLEPAVTRLIDGAAHRVSDLADLLDAPSRLVLVRRLVREGLLVVHSDG